MIKKLTRLEEFCLNSIILGGDIDLAYSLSRPNKTKCEDTEVLHKMALRWLRKEECKKYLELKKAELTRFTKVTSTNLRGREEVIRELNQLATIEVDSKKKADILLKIADLERMKEQSAKKSEQLHYYMPLRCTTCNLYKQAKNKPK